MSEAVAVIPDFVFHPEAETLRLVIVQQRADGYVTVTGFGPGLAALRIADAAQAITGASDLMKEVLG